MHFTQSYLCTYSSTRERMKSQLNVFNIGEHFIVNSIIRMVKHICGKAQKLHLHKLQYLLSSA